jgi:hypothetical protein
MDPTSSQPRRSVRPIGEIGRRLRTWIVNPDRVPLEDLQSVWARAAGREIAGQSRVRAYARGRLVVGVSSPVLRAELESFRRQEILGKIHLIAPELAVREVRFVIEAGAE